MKKGIIDISMYIKKEAEIKANGIEIREIVDYNRFIIIELDSFHLETSSNTTTLRNKT